MIRLKFTFRVEYETDGEYLAAAPGAERRGWKRRLGFSPAFLDFQSFTIYSSRYADGALAAKSRLISGFQRSGFFYTRRAASRAAREWAGTG